MKPDELFHYYANMSDNRVLVSFKGPISKDILVEMGGFVRRQLASNQEVKRIFSVFVEMTQNVLRHSDEKDPTNGNNGIGVVVLVEKEHEYAISSGNLVQKSRCKKLTEQCDMVNALDQDGLKKAYKEQRKADWDDLNGGAGLGLIDICRKSGNPLAYQVIPFNEEKDFLVLTAKVSRGKI
ncbi:MAG: SiaB family protein kinase [Verrucomicrobiota bacterium]